MEDLKHEVDEIKAIVTESQESKTERAANRWAIWLPAIVAILGPIAVIGMYYGVVQTEIGHLKESDAELRSEIMPMPQRMQVFVSRVEFAAELSNLQREIAELKTIAKDTNDKLNRLTTGREIELK